MHTKLRFSIADFLLGIVVLSILLSIPASWTAIAAVGLGILFALSFAIVANLPKSIRKAMEENCIRFDGNVSQRRAHIERRSLIRLRFDVAGMLAIVLIPSLVMFWLVNAELFPLVSVPFWINQESGLASNFQSWLSSSHVNGTEYESYKEFIKSFWPLIAFAGALWVGIGFFVLRVAYVNRLRDLMANVMQRGKAYRLQEYSRIEDRSNKKQQVDSKSTREAGLA